MDKQPTYEEVFTLEHLYESVEKCRKGVRWKGTVQSYVNHEASKVYQTSVDLKARKAKTGRFFHFTIMERGKVRHIKSVRIDERVVQRCFCDHCLVPLLTRKFIYDNSACIKGKGMHFAIRRLKRYLHRYWMKHGNEGYILQFDFHHYFETIPHEKLIEMVAKVLKDKDLCNLYRQLVEDFGGDTGLGLGSQISQISALYYPHRIDERFAYDKEVFAYARYMDDGYLIAEKKETLVKCLEVLKTMCAELGIALNEKKTQIRKLGHTFEFLKARVTLHRNGRIVVKPNRKNVTRNRRKLRKLKALHEIGLVDAESAEMVFKTTLGNFQNFDAFHARRRYNNLYQELFQGGKRNEIPDNDAIQRGRHLGTVQYPSGDRSHRKRGQTLHRC